MNEFYPVSDARLTEEQQRYTEQRILHDALLISQDARVNTLGRLVITETQYQMLAASESVDEARETWLNQTIEDALLGGADPDEISMVTRAVNALKRERLVTRRDVLVTGRVRVFDMRNVGSRTLEILESVLDNEFGVSWLDRPEAADIARFCTGLWQVSSIAIADRTICNIDKSSFYSPFYVLSVQDILDRQEEIGEVPSWLPEEKQKFARLHREQEIASHIRAAVMFAEEFHVAQISAK